MIASFKVLLFPQEDENNVRSKCPQTVTARHSGTREGRAAHTQAQASERRTGSVQAGA